MGFIGSEPPLVTATPLGARDFIWLAALGAASRAACSVDGVCLTLDAAGAARREDLFAATGLGHRALCSLLGRPTRRPASPLGQVALRLKLAFLDLEPVGLRRASLLATITACEAALGDRERHGAGCAFLGAYGNAWRRHDIDRLHGDLAVLRSMLAHDAGPRPVSH